APGVYPTGSRIDDSYLHRHRPTAERRVKVARARLAAPLDATLAEATPRCCGCRLPERCETMPWRPIDGSRPVTNPAVHAPGRSLPVEPGISDPRRLHSRGPAATLRPCPTSPS